MRKIYEDVTYVMVSQTLGESAGILNNVYEKTVTRSIHEGRGGQKKCKATHRGFQWYNSLMNVEPFDLVNPISDLDWFCEMDVIPLGPIALF